MWVGYDIATEQSYSLSSQANRNVNISKFVESPELELFVHNVPAQASNDCEVDMRLPTADFYLDCLVSEAFQPSKPRY